MKNHWVLSECPHYESDQINEKLKFAYWEGHRDFAYDLLNFVNPKKIVELGSQYGCSLFAFCQSVKDNGLKTQINAVDYWKGDIGAENTGEEVYEIVKQTIKKFFRDVDINLYQMDFDSALDSFEDSSIDILHIDGGHRYEDVEHDLNSWISKLKENGIILFHDVFSHIDSGSCEHWEQTKKKYPALYFEFRHSCGLGILFPKGNYWYENMISEGFMDKYYPVYYYRSLYKYTKRRFEELEGLYRERYETIIGQSKMITERDTVIASQKALIDEKDKGICSQSQMIEERDVVIASQKVLIDEKDEGIQNQSKMIEERDVVIASQKALIDEKDKGIQNQSQMINERDAVIASQKALIDEKDEGIQNQSQMIDERDAVIISQKALIDEKDEGIQNQSQMIDERDAVIISQKALIDEKDEGIQNQSKMIEERDTLISDQERIIVEQAEKLEYLNQLVQEVNRHKIISRLIFHKKG